MAIKAANLNAVTPRPVKEETPFSIIMRRFRKHRMAMISLGVISVIFLISLFAKQIAPFTADAVNVNNRFDNPGTLNVDTGKVHILGTDNIGRDYFSRLLYAGRISLSVAFLSVLISEVIGIVIGSIAGFYGGWLDAVLMRFVEFLLTIPSLPLLLIISSMLMQNPDLIPIPEPVLNVLGKVMLLRPSDARQAVLIVLVLAGLGWLTAAQLMRGSILSLREQTFVEAARSLGASNGRIIFNHMIPNSMAPIIVDASLSLAGFIVAEASLSFLGFGIQDPIPHLGQYAFRDADLHV